GWAVGGSYEYGDSGLANSVPYFYELEDIETTGGVTRHGPVIATPQASSSTGGDDSGSGGGGATGGDGGSSSGTSGPERTAHGNPSSSLQVVERDARHVVLELTTGGFYTTPQGTSVRIEVPGFEDRSRPGDPALPTRHAWVEATAGRKVQLTSIEALDTVSFAGLRPEAAARPGIEVGRYG